MLRGAFMHSLRDAVAWHDLHKRLIALATCKMTGQFHCLVFVELMDSLADAHVARFMDHFRTHARTLVQCPHGNHVLKKGIEAGGYKATSWVLEELLQTPGDVLKLSKHHYGCHIVLRVLSSFPLDTVEGSVVEPIVDQVVSVSKHISGRYVVSALLERNDIGPQRSRMLRELINNVSEVAACKHNSSPGCTVLGAVLGSSISDQQQELVEAILKEDGLIARMACNREGVPVVLALLDLLE